MKTMKMRRLYFAIPVVLLALAMPAKAGTRYLASMPDIPLMAQMNEIKDSRVVFDKAEGRIVEEVVKSANISAAEVLKFYHETLPALGWTSQGMSGSLARFSRNGEQLIVNLEKLQAEGLVSFAVSPNRP
ncbi:MAG: hypothetical protein DI586_00475 [Micavibrio aeruginosavorus]|uniref:Uncharacterized protein n=1 Tax=Micavibrio aeruginosavorus TaxID=349221 RepID=A0A2W5HUT6_9BACT|nr:MAG: hypothetical protein DI586_00475 [Micavibrio aeruginosavorus]